VFNTIAPMTVLQWASWVIIDKGEFSFKHFHPMEGETAIHKVSKE